MAEDTAPKKKKPNFWRRDWHKKIRYGKHKTKNGRVWRAAKGRQNKIRLGKAGYAKRPKVGYGQHNELKGQIAGHAPIMISSMKDLENLKKGEGVVLANFGKKKREEILKVCKDKGFIVLNKYKENTPEGTSKK